MANKIHEVFFDFRCHPRSKADPLTPGGIKQQESITFKDNPFAFLLMYCDVVQDWGRVKPSKHKEVSEQFGENEFINDDCFFKNGAIISKIFYKKQNIDYEAWEENIYNEFLNPLTRIWVAGFNNKISFKIEYYYRNGRGEEVKMPELGFP